MKITKRDVGHWFRTRGGWYAQVKDACSTFPKEVREGGTGGNYPIRTHHRDNGCERFHLEDGTWKKEPDEKDLVARVGDKEIEVLRALGLLKREPL
jgi:hypothetical protein